MIEINNGLRPVVNGQPCDFTLELDHAYVFSNFDDAPMTIDFMDEEGQLNGPEIDLEGCQVLAIQPRSIAIVWEDSSDV